MEIIIQKKTLHPCGQQREDVVEKRRIWKENQWKLDVSKLKFLDEMSINCGMTRLYGRASRNERVNDYVPDVRFERRSVISVLGINGVIAPIMFGGTLNGDLFRRYVEEILTPELAVGDVVVMDNSAVHKVKGVLDSIYEKGASVMFLPEYSPDLNPIELMHSRQKSTLRKLKARTPEKLENAMGAAINSITCNDIVGWFQHDGYFVNN